MIFYATCAYGLEGALSRELKGLGFTVIDTQTSRVAFEGGFDEASRANLMLRTAGRVRLQTGQFDCKTFDELFENIVNIPWENYIEKGVRFHITARSLSSELHSVPAIQSIAQKAIFERLSKKYRQQQFFGQDKYSIEVHIYKDHVSVSIDTTGEPLHKRGYRILNPEAALRETLAAALVIYSGWRCDWPLLDPFCGSGTIVVEAAMFAANMPPGANRGFSSEQWPWWDKKAWDRQRQKAKDEIVRTSLPAIIGSDNDEKVLLMAKTHIKKAGLTNVITILKADATTMSLSQPEGYIVTNPPYGERMGEERMIKELYLKFFKNINSYRGWSCNFLSARGDVEKLAERKANKKRKLKNGQIDCTYYQFFTRR